MGIIFSFLFAVFFTLMGANLDEMLGTGYLFVAGGVLGFLAGGYFPALMSRIPYGGFVPGGIIGFFIARLLTLFLALAFNIKSAYFHNGLLLLFVIPFGFLGHFILSRKK